MIDLELRNGIISIDDDSILFIIGKMIFKHFISIHQKYRDPLFQRNSRASRLTSLSIFY